MSNKKTISINPKLFNISKTKTQKNKPKKQEKVNIIPPNLFKNKILKRIQKHKQQEVKNNNKNNNKNNSNSNNHTNNNTDDKEDDEFTSSMNYLNTIAKNKKKPRHKTIKKNEKTNMNVYIELPEELEEIKSSNLVLNDVPYGVLKKGKKPTYREYYNKTLKNKSNNMNTNTINEFNKYDVKSQPVIENKTPVIENKTPVIENKTPDIENKTPIIDEIFFDDFDDDLDMDTYANTNANTVINVNDDKFQDKPIAKSSKQNLNFKSTPILNKKTTSNVNIKNNCSNLPKKANKITKTTIKKKYTLGKNKNKRKVGVLIKNNKTQKQVSNAYKELKKTPLKEIKDYLYKHNLIKIGSNIPIDVGRQMFEAAKLTGNVININSNNILHNLENANDDNA